MIKYTARTVQAAPEDQPSPITSGRREDGHYLALDSSQLPIMFLAYPRLHDVSHLFILLAIVAAACELSLVLFFRIPGEEAIVTLLSPPPMIPSCGEISLAS